MCVSHPDGVGFPGKNVIFAEEDRVAFSNIDERVMH
jgi:hypothetical protein